MYDMTPTTQNRLPAPYELNNYQNTPPDTASQSFARGGRASRHGKMTKVHMNRHELNVLDHLQGGPEYGHEGIKVFSHLEELLKNPHIVQNVHHHAQRHHHAFGGDIRNEIMRRMGRHGDNELAMIGPHTHRLFNEMAGYPTRNPHTGHPEYFSIGKALSGLWHGIKGVASPVVNAVKGIAQGAAPVVLPALGAEFGPMGVLAGNMAGNAVQSVLGKPQETNPYSAFGQNAARAYQGGANARESLGQGLRHAGLQVNGRAGSALEGVGNSLFQNRGVGQSLRNGFQSGMSMPANQQHIPLEEPSQGDSEMFGNMFAGG